MNIDFHYGVIYLTARLAGLGSADAQVVAHACQYVDDATNDGVLRFKDGESFERCASAHEMLDYRNALDAQNRLIWVPFHFLPAAQGESLDDKAICQPDSAVAREMVQRALNRPAADNTLHRLGVTLHVYVDTWAHQGFSGIVSNNNRIVSLEGDGHPHEVWFDKFKNYWRELGNDLSAVAIDAVSGLGHGAALHFPDLPWAVWNYTKLGQDSVRRENLPEFIKAADMACKVVQGFIHKNSHYLTEPGLPLAAKTALEALLKSNQDHDAQNRLQALCDAVANGAIPGLKEKIPTYIAKGEGSWKHAATGIADANDSGAAPTWTPAFETSDYRKFHDATKEHRFLVTQEILPAFNVRLA